VIHRSAVGAAALMLLGFAGVGCHVAPRSAPAEAQGTSPSGLTADGRDTVVAWEIADVSPRSTALHPNEVRRETFRFPVSPPQARLVTVRAKLAYHFAPSTGTFAREGPSTPMAEASIGLPGSRHP